MTPEKLTLMINEKYPKEVFFKPQYVPILANLPEVDNEEEEAEEEGNDFAPSGT